MIGTIAGAPVILSTSWLVTAPVLTVLFAPVVSRWDSSLGARAYVVALAFVLLLFGSVFLHELSHGLLARRFGATVQEYALTLWGGHTRFSGHELSAGATMAVAVVGPLTNLALAALFWLAWQAAGTGLAAMLLVSAVTANAFVGVFNLVPALPLDGGQVLAGVVWAVTGRRATGTLVAGWAGRVFAVGLVCWVLGAPLLRGQSPDLYGVGWAALIAVFLWSGADQAVRSARVETAVAGFALRGLVRPAAVVAWSATVADVDAAMAMARAATAVVLAPDGRPAGVVDAEVAATVPPAHRASTPVSAVTRPLPGGAVVDAGLVGRDAVGALAEVARLSPVLAALDGPGGPVIGVVLTDDAVRALR